MPELLETFTREIGSSPRRGVLRVLVAVGAGGVIGALNAPTANAKKKGKSKNKNKGKNKDKCRSEQRPNCDACPNGDECPSACSIVLTGVGGEKICAETYILPDCTPCTAHGQCDPFHPYCVTEAESLATGEKTTLSCKGTPPGMCVLASACAEFL